ncbi:DUF1836 domain-containing protein [Dehalobacter sp.]|uniref:DUF1836 domain-containing protein n=1 Tax=Dehalobacter sp. TaxID=1962289 RepID=UPI00258E5FA2|nr:DUF1836 domain-containing protein [Dehalobacter sp.]MDJ0306785.1 DUF1836 domain-containing protein [Dehalobacter sp.]
MADNASTKKESNQHDAIFNQIPDKVKYSSVEKFFRNAPEPFNNVEITRRIFTSYIQNGILPETEKANRLNDKFTLYTKDQIVYFYLAQQLKSLTKLENISKLFSALRNDEIGLSAQDVYELFNLGNEFYAEIEVTLVKTIKELLISNITEDGNSVEDLENEFEESKEILMPLLWLVMAKCCIDGFNEHVKNFDKRGIDK